MRCISHRRGRERVQERSLSVTSDRVLGVFLALSLLVPLLIAGLWGDAYADAAYQQFQQARAIARGADRSLDGFSPLYTLFLALMTRLPWPLATVALVLGVLGWVAAVATWFWAGLRLDRPMFSIAAAGLLALHPLQPQVLGLESGLATLWMMRGRRAAMLVTTAVLLLTQPMTLSFVIPMLFYGQKWRRLSPTLAHVSVSVGIGGAGYALVCVLSGGYREPRLTAVLLGALELLVAAGFAFLVSHVDSSWRSTAQKRTLWRGIVTLCLLTLALWQGNTLLQGWRTRPTDRLALYRATARWLHDYALPTETIGTQHASLLGYLSDHTTLALPAAATTRAPALLAAITRELPDYCVAPNSLAWHGVRSQPWFQEHYQQVYQLASPYDSGTPLTVFRYTPSPFDGGQTISTTLHFGLGTGEEIELTGYRLDTRRITPGEPLHLTLYWRAVTAIHASSSLTVRLADPATGRIWAQIENPAPGGLKTDFWNAGTQVADRYALTPPIDIPSGDYALQVAFRAQGGGAAPLLVGGGSSGDERFTLAQVYRPPIISELSPTPDQRLSLTFSGQIELLGYDVPERLAAGETLRLALYWHALEPVSLDYKVFTHLLTPDGQLLAQHDSPPANGEYPTTRWRTGEYIRDEHLLVLDPSTPRGDYVLSIGLYDPITGERAAVRDADGNEVAEQRAVLQLIQVR
jgi:hypothetical protein